MNMPQEVKRYFENGRRTIVSVHPNADYTLTLTFDNGEIRLYDMKPMIDQGVFARIKEKFDEVFISEDHAVAWDIDSNIDSSVHWNNRVDLWPDSCYLHSMPL